MPELKDEPFDRNKRRARQKGQVEETHPELEDMEFVPDMYAASQIRASVFSQGLLIVIGVFLVVFFGWASVAKLDEVTRGVGKVIPSSKVQVIQNLEGGIVAEILVREGQIVDEGDVLLKVENRLAQADFQETNNKYWSLKAKIARLEAELEGADTVTFSEDLMEKSPDAVLNEQSLFEARQNQLKSQLDVLKAQINQKQQELSQIQSSINSFERSMNISEQQLDIVRRSVERGIAPRIDQLNSEKELNEIQSQLEVLKLQLPTVESTIQEAQSRYNERQEASQTEAQTELSAARQELRNIAEFIEVDQDRVERTEVKSPVRGTVQNLKFNTIGGVIQPGDDLVEIVPLDDKLLIEARIRPSDIAFVRQGQEATIRLSAYDYTIYGTLVGHVEDISPDTIVDEQGQTFYRVRVETDQNGLSYNGQRLAIKSGMTATVDVMTGQKTVLQYIFKPLNKARQSALTER